MEKFKATSEPCRTRFWLLTGDFSSFNEKAGEIAFAFDLRSRRGSCAETAVNITFEHSSGNRKRREK
jgi:hypothetical protein